MPPPRGRSCVIRPPTKVVCMFFFLNSEAPTKMGGIWVTLAKSREDLQLPGTSPTVLVLGLSTCSKEVGCVPAWVVVLGRFEPVLWRFFVVFLMGFLRGGHSVSGITGFVLRSFGPPKAYLKPPIQVVFRMSDVKGRPSKKQCCSKLNW